MSAREVVARALFAERRPQTRWEDAPEKHSTYLHRADLALAALAADPGTVERAARALWEFDREDIPHPEPYEVSADLWRGFARAALGDGVVGERDGRGAVPLTDEG